MNREYTTEGIGFFTNLPSTETNYQPGLNPQIRKEEGESTDTGR